ncbi:hypothetical protein F5X68DRAFT_125630, partial [Plectosphaerella plurivora]
MRQTLRRSCDACAKSKHSCDLRTPRCSRCVKRQVRCLYANEPLTATPIAPKKIESAPLPSPPDLGGSAFPLVSHRLGSIDPFDSYPQTRLPRERVQRLIHSFLNKIAFQYYPLDLNASSNPFLVSWWPLALGDPALFHVSLQTACLDEELIAQKGFQASEILMADSVALLRRKVEDESQAVQDGTMNSVITLAAIEFGKGNIKVADMHVAGVKRLADMRGGINAVRQTSPLTARMVSWVSMLILGHPQFTTQDDLGTGLGIPPTPEWQLDLATLYDQPSVIDGLDIDYDVANVFLRLRAIFQRAATIPLSTTRLHDLTCFVIHRLLPSKSDLSHSGLSPITESVRYAVILYMFIIHGPTYYSHAVILDDITARFIHNLQQLDTVIAGHESLAVWFTAIGLVASSDSAHYGWFSERAGVLAASLGVEVWHELFTRIRSVLWLEMTRGEYTFSPHWDAALGQGN